MHTPYSTPHTPSPQVKDALTHATRLLTSIQSGRAFRNEDHSLVESITRIPIVAYGLTHQLGTLISSPRFYNDTALSRSVSNALTILHFISTHHHTLTQNIATFTFKALHQLDVNKEDTCKLLLDLAVTTITCGAAEHVMKLFTEWSGTKGTD